MNKLIAAITSASMLVSISSGGADLRFVSLEEQMTKQAGAIKIPVLEFKETTLAEAVEFLRKDAIKRDPNHVGIRIDLQLQPEFVIVPNTTAPPGGWPRRNRLDTPITLSKRNISLVEALRDVAGLADCVIVPRKDGLSIMQRPVSADPIVTHTIPLPEAIFGKLANPEKAGVSKAEIGRMRADLKKYFIESGINFPSFASCSFDTSGMTITVTNTLDQIDLVHVVLEGLVQHQVPKKKR